MSGPANPLRGEAPLLVGKTTYKLAIDPNAFVYAEEAYGKLTDQLIADADKLGERVNMKLVRTLVWAALQKYHACSQSEAGDIIADATYPVARDAVQQCLRVALGVAEVQDSADPPEKVEAGTG